MLNLKAPLLEHTQPHFSNVNTSRNRNIMTTVKSVYSHIQLPYLQAIVHILDQQPCDCAQWKQYHMLVS